jgi:DNA-binding IscR family transcriptional regulator
LRLSSRAREKLVLLSARLIGAAHYESGKPVTCSELARDTEAALEAVEWAVNALEKSGLIVHTGEAEAAYLPARPPDATPLSAILQVVQTTDDVGPMASGRLAPDPSVDGLVSRLDEARISGVEGVTWRDFILEEKCAPTNQS